MTECVTRNVTQGNSERDMTGVDGSCHAVGMNHDAPSVRLRSAREKLGISRARLAAKLGVSQSTIRAHENGQNGIQPSVAEQYALELGVSPQWILFGADGAVAPEKGNVFDIPVVGVARPGYFPESSSPFRGDHISLAIPGYERLKLKAYLREDRIKNGLISYVVCTSWEGDALYLSDRVVLRRSQGELAEIDVWNVGSDPEWVLFYKGRTQASATEILKLRPNPAGHLGAESGVWVLGLVVARFEYTQMERVRGFTYPVR